MKGPFIAEIAPETYAINEYGLSAMYLLRGTERALLIDTGCGVCDLQAVIHRLTDQPLVVALTHGHLDHAGGCGIFSEVYVHPADIDLIRQITAKDLRDYCEMMRPRGVYEAYDFDTSGIREDRHLPEMKYLKEGDVFHLGDRDIEVYETPGHTAGSVVFLDRKRRILISGDACNDHTLLLGGSVTDMLHTAEKLKGLESAYDQDFNGHIGYGGAPDCLSLPRAVNSDMIRLCRSILDGTAQTQEFPSFTGGMQRRAVCGCAELMYSADAPME